MLLVHVIAVPKQVDAEQGAVTGEAVVIVEDAVIAAAVVEEATRVEGVLEAAELDARDVTAVTLDTTVPVTVAIHPSAGAAMLRATAYHAAHIQASATSVTNAT